MALFNGKELRYHFDGVRFKTTQIRELVEVIDQMFDSFQRVNMLSRTMLGRPRKKVEVQQVSKREKRRAPRV